MTIPTSFRVLVAIIAAMATSFVLLVAVELFSSVVHPFPSGFNGTPEEVCAHVARYPYWVLAVIVPMWGFVAFLGTWVAGRLGNGTSASILALLLLAAVILNVSMLPYPMWFKLVQPLAILVSAACGYRTSIHRTLNRSERPQRTSPTRP